MNNQNYSDKAITSRRKRNSQSQFPLQMSNDDLHFVADFVNDSAFYLEDLEECVGEEISDFWRMRDHALRILTDWMMQMASAPASIASKAA